MQKACILSVSGPVLLPAEAALLARTRPFGVILMGRSCISRTQVAALVADIWQATGEQTLMFIDQEGGRVARLRPPEWPVFPSAGTYGALYRQDAALGLEAVQLGHRLIASELSAMSIHADCAPVVDLAVQGAHEIIGDRAFSGDPGEVAAMARAALQGLACGGVAGVIKHIPGHGRAFADSHLELPRVTASAAEMEPDFEAFAGVAASAPMAMTAHIAYEAYDPGRAATVSELVVSRIIRGRIGFDGLLMTDDLGMKALGGTLAGRVAASIAAGCDVLLHCSGFLTDPERILAEMTEVAEASPWLSGIAEQRARRAVDASRMAEPFDTGAGWDRLRALIPAARELA